MDNLLKAYLDECSRICDAKGYTGLSRELPLIKKRLSGNGNGEVIERYVQETIRHCEELNRKGARILAWQFIDEKTLVERLSKINNSPQEF